VALEFDANKTSATQIAALVAAASSENEHLSAPIIETLLNNGRILSVTKDCQISGRSDKDICFYIVLSGSVRISTNNADGREFVLSYFTAGSMWGLRPCLMNESRSHDTFAETDVSVLAVTNKVIYQLMRDDAHMMQAVVKILCGRVKYISDAIEQFAIHTTQEQIAWRLLELYESHGHQSDHGVTTLQHISQHSLAAMVGKSRQSTNKVLKEFERDGIINIQYNQITITNPQALKAIIEK